MLGRGVGIHTHDDSGFGVANALAGVRAGAVQVQGTINGYGERVGNCNLTTVMPKLQLKMGIDLGLDLTKLRDLSNFVDELANVPHHIRAPYVGSAAFTHKGGLHVHAVQKLARTYEHVDPALVGNSRVITISDMAGQSNVIVKAETMGFKLQKGSEDVAKILSEVKRLESEGYEFEAAEASFDLLIRRCLQQSQPLFDLLEYHCSFRRSGDGACNKCEATVKIAVGDEKEYTVAEGDGPVNALDVALRHALRPFYPKIDQIVARGLQGPHHQRPEGDRRPHARLHPVVRRARRVGHGRRERQHHRRQLARAGGLVRVQAAEVTQSAARTVVSSNLNVYYPCRLNSFARAFFRHHQKPAPATIAHPIPAGIPARAASATVVMT